MANLNKETKSNRLLQSLRYTIAIGDGQEAFTNVLDLNATEIYTQEFLIPTSSLPYSQSSQDGEIVSSSIADPSYSPEVSILKYYWRLELTPSTIVTDGKSQTWFTLSPPQTNVNPQLVNSNQLTNWVSNKYYDPAFPTRNTEGNDPGYRIIILSGSSGGTAANAEPIDGTLYQFDYKTGVLNFYSSSQSPSEGDKLYITAYRYIGQTLDTFISEGGGGGGTPGTSGTSGTTGTSGTSGTSGTTGTSGTSGTTGTSGTSGTSGTTGTSGTSGTTGTSGTSGTTGTSGTSGTTGTSGTSGTTGTSGTSGTTGTSGTSGTTGTSGTSGTTGTSGTSGTTGTSGTWGTTGTSGTSGTTGTSGTSGTTGTSGTSGTTGTSGTSGTTGTSGTSGTTGTSGTSGTTGTSGTSGTTGTSGTSGTTGTSGTSGTTGTSGTSGTTGTSGTSGTTGTSGTSGTSISLTVVSGSIEGTGIERLEISGSGNLIVNSPTASINIEGGGNTTQYQTGSGTTIDLGLLKIYDFDDNVFVTSDPNTGQLTLQFGTAPDPTVSLSSTGFNTDRFSLQTDDFTISNNFEFVGTFISASFTTESSPGVYELISETTDENDDPFNVSIGPSQTGLQKTLSSGSHTVRGTIRITNALGEIKTAQSDLSLTLNKVSPSTPTLTVEWNNFYGGTDYISSPTGNGNSNVEFGITGSVTASISLGTANGWYNGSVTGPISKEFLTYYDYPSNITLTQTYNSDGNGDPSNNSQSKIKSFTRIASLRYGLSTSSSLTADELIDLESWITGNGIEDGQINFGTTTSGGINNTQITLDLSGDDAYVYIVYDKDVSNLTQLIQSNQNILDQFESPSTPTNSEFKYYRSTNKLISPTTFEATLII